MARYTCECGARYRFPDTSVGKRAKCKKCGAVFTLEDENAPIPVSDEIGVADEFAAATERARATPTQPRPGELSTTTRFPPAPGDSPPLDVGGETGKSYASDVLWTFLFPSSPGNLITFLILWVILWCALGVISFTGRSLLLALVLWVLVFGWYSAYRFAVLGEAVAGSEDLPNVNIGTEGVVDLLHWLVKWIGSWVVALLPAIAYLVVAVVNGQITENDLLDLSRGGITGLLQGPTGGMASFVALVCLGLFMWPMVVLCIALGGFEALYRIDLIAVTIVKTFPVYLLTVALMFGAVFGRNTLEVVVGAGVGGILVTGIRIYTDIVLLRLIGLYYHHFKDRFAWSWG